MTDTDSRFEQIVAARHAAMTPAERLAIASQMFEVARKIVASSLSSDLTRAQKRFAIAQRIYGDALPRAALEQHANYLD